MKFKLWLTLRTIVIVYFFFSAIFSSCSPENEKPPLLARTSRKFSPAKIVLTIINPKTTLIDTCPRSKSFSLLEKQTNIFKNRSPEGMQSREAYSFINAYANLPIASDAKGIGFFTNYTTDKGLALDAINCAIMDSMGNLWFGTDAGGISRYDGKSFTNFTTTQGLANDQVLSIMEDKTGNLWIGTYGGGISCYNGESFTNCTTVKGLSNNIVRSIMEDEKGNIWIGTNGGGVSCYNVNRLNNPCNSNKCKHDLRIPHDLEVHNKEIAKFFTGFTTDQGLANNTVWCIREDKTGNIWFGTDGGVSRYDGKCFTNFTIAQGLANNVVRSIAEDSRGNLWFGTDGGGLSRYDWNQLNNLCNSNKCKHDFGIRQDLQQHNHELAKLFTNFTTVQGLASNNINCITKDKTGNLWIGTYGGGLSRYDGNWLTNLCNSNKCEHDLLVKKDIEEHNKEIAKSFSNFTTSEGLTNNNIWSITEDKTGNLWIGTYGGGISRYDGKSFISFTTAQGLANNIVFGITEDKSGNLWLGTDGGGINRYVGDSQDGSTVSFTNCTIMEKLSSNNIFCITEDKKQNLWFGTYNAGLVRYDGKSFTNFTTVQGLANNSIWCITEDITGNLWIGTGGGGVSRYDGKSFINLTTAQGLANNSVRSILQDRTGNLWFGTYGGGVSCYNKHPNDRSKASFINYTTAQGLSNNMVNSIKEDKMGNLWLATQGGGLSRYDGKSFINFTTAQGLPDNVVTQIVIDTLQNIIFGTNHGVGVLVSFTAGNSKSSISAQNNMSSEELKNYIPNIEIYNSSTGYPVKDVNAGQNAKYKDSRGIIWIATGSDKTGLVRFDYNALHKNENAPRVFIQNLKINNENICWNDLNSKTSGNSLKVDSTASPPNIVEEVTVFGHVLTKSQRDTMDKKFGAIQFEGVASFYPVPINLRLPYNHNNITFEFAAIEPARPNLVKYQYILDGYDKEWSPISNKSSASFGNIFEGTYTLKLKAQSPFGVWSEPITYTFTVLPPWYRAWWAYGVYLLTASGLVFSLIRLRTATLRKDKEALEQTVKERTNEYLVQKNTAEKLARVKEDFLSNMSHEIRTPLNAIIGYTDMSLQEALTEKANKNLQAVKLSSQHLRRLVDDILDYSKIESGKLSFHETDFNLKQTLEAVKQLLDFQSLQKGNSISISVAEDVPVALLGDKEKLMQVLINLLDNAVKFTTKGEINLDVHLTKKENEECELLFNVKDTGIGIPEDKLKIIFESFTQADNNISRKYGGTGLGLAITKRIVELQNGTIKVSSVVNKGTQFSLTLPYRIGKEEAIKEEQFAIINPTVKLCFLAAEDDSINRDILQQMLKKLGANIDFAETGEQLLQLLKINKYDLVFLDIHMPVMNGFEIAGMIRTNPDVPLRNIPIVALTADVLPGTRKKIEESGMNECIYKPVDFKELCSKIITLLNLKSEFASTDPNKNTWEIATQHLNLNYLSETYEGNKKDMLKVLNTSASKLSEYTSSLGIAFSNKNSKEVLFIAHKFVTVAEILGISSIKSKLFELQESVLLEKPYEEVSNAVECINDIGQMASNEIKDVIDRINKN